MIGAIGAGLARLRELGSGSRINRRPSALVAHAMPWASVMLGSLFTALAWIASAPVLPPFGLLVLIAWRQLRPGLLPVWAGLPLGLFDDLYSGQPMGSAVLLWSGAMLVLEAIEARVPWRGFPIDWIIAAILIAIVLALGTGLANLAGGATPLRLLGPQITLSTLLYPLVGRTIAALDRLRLIAFIEVRPWD